MQYILTHVALLFLLTCTNGNNLKNNNNSDALQYEDTMNAQNGVDTNHADTTLSGEWELIPILASDTATGRLPKLIFNLADNSFTGNTGCNSMSGSFVKNGYALHFNENVILTKMDCLGYNETGFMENFLKTDNYSIEDGVLQLKSGQTILSKWARNVQVTPLEKI